MPCFTLLAAICVVAQVGVLLSGIEVAAQPGNRPTTSPQEELHQDPSTPPVFYVQEPLAMIFAVAKVVLTGIFLYQKYRRRLRAAAKRWG